MIALNISKLQLLTNRLQMKIQMKMLLQKNSRGILFLANKDVHQMQTNKSLKMTKMTKKALNIQKKSDNHKNYTNKKNINNVKIK